MDLSGSFGWDCEFASFLASLGSKAMAYSSFITIVKAKVGNGFVPNCASACSKSEDRTEPNAAAKILLELYKKYGDRWLVELLFDDALDTNNWAVRERTLEPLNMISLGTSTEAQHKDAATGKYTCDLNDPNSGCMQAMQSARYESGQDNSPMYDQQGIHPSSSGADPAEAASDSEASKAGRGRRPAISGYGNFMPDLNNASSWKPRLVGKYIQMPLYDVGMTSLLVSEAEALAELAEVLGRAETAAMLRARCLDMRARIQAHLWSEALGMYSNAWPNGTFYPRIGPTSFFLLFARAPTAAQVSAADALFMFAAAWTLVPSFGVTRC